MVDGCGLTVLYITPMRTGLALGLLIAAASISLVGCEKMQARSLIKEGNSLYKAGNLAEALRRYEQSRQLDPDFPTLQLHLGYTNMALAALYSPPKSTYYYSGAADAFETLMKLAPADDRGPRYYLQVLLDADRLDDALTFLKKQHKRNPKDVKTVSSLGMVASKAGKLDEALGWYEKRATLLPGEARARYLIGTLCWKQLYKNDRLAGEARVRLADRGLAALEQALGIRPDYGEALTYANLLYRERAKGQVDQAARDRDMGKAREYYKRAMAVMKKAKAKAEADKTPAGTN